MVHKVKNSDLKSFLGDDWIQIHNRKIQQQAMRDIRGRQGIMFSLTSVMMTFVLLVILLLAKQPRSNTTSQRWNNIFSFITNQHQPNKVKSGCFAMLSELGLEHSRLLSKTR